MKVSVVGGVFGSSGYDIHTRNLVLALMNEGVSVGVETGLVNGWEFLCTDELKKALSTDNRCENVIMVGLPQFWPVKLSDRSKSFSGFLVFEGDKIPDDWVRICNDDRVDNVFVPSKHVRDACKGVKRGKLKVVPHGVNVQIFHPLNKLIESPRKTRFLFVGGWSQGENDRKNLPFLLRCFCEEFGKEDNVELVVKINPVYNVPGFDFEGALRALGLPEDRPSIKLVVDLLDDGALNELYNSCDVFVCPSRAEGFGLVFLEAMACGKPCVVGGFGGQLDFVSEDNGWLLKSFKLVPSKDMNPIYEDTLWAEYDKNELKAVLRHIYNNPEEVLRKGRNALNEAISWSWKKTAKEIIKNLK